MRRGYIPGQTLFYYHARNDKEIDFVTRKGAVVPGRGGGIMVGISEFTEFPADFFEIIIIRRHYML